MFINPLNLELTSGLLTVDGQMEPGAIVPRAGRSVRKDDPALVPALVALPDVGDVDAALAESPAHGILDQVDAADVAVLRRGRAVVPRENRPALKR